MRLYLVCALLLAAPSALAGVRVDSRTRGSNLDLTFTNTGDRPIEIDRRVMAAIASYDWLTVELVQRNEAPITFDFREPRGRASEIETSRLAPGAAVTETIDLVPWAVRAGTPLAAGVYRVTARWNASASEHAKFDATAVAGLVVPDVLPASPSTTCGAKQGDLRVVARQVPGTTTLDYGIHNAGIETLCLQAPPAACITSTTKTTLVLDATSGGMRAGAERAEPCPAPTSARELELPPGATLWANLDVAAHAGALRSGTYAVVVIVDTRDDTAAARLLLAVP